MRQTLDKGIAYAKTQTKHAHTKKTTNKHTHTKKQQKKQQKNKHTYKVKYAHHQKLYFKSLAQLWLSLHDHLRLLKRTLKNLNFLLLLMIILKMLFFFVRFI